MGAIRQLVDGGLVAWIMRALGRPSSREDVSLSGIAWAAIVLGIVALGAWGFLERGPSRTTHRHFRQTAGWKFERMPVLNACQLCRGHLRAGRSDRLKDLVDVRLVGRLRDPLALDLLEVDTGEACVIDIPLRPDLVRQASTGPPRDQDDSARSLRRQPPGWCWR